MHKLLSIFLVLTLTTVLPASTSLIEGFIISVDNAKVTIEATNHYKKGSTVTQRIWKFHANDAYALDNRLVPRQMALQAGRKIYIWGKKGGAFFCVLSEAATVVNGTVVKTVDGHITIAVKLGDGNRIERAFAIGATEAPAKGTETILRPARPFTIEALSPSAATAAIPAGDPKLVVLEGFVQAATDCQNISMIDLSGAARQVSIDYRVSRGLLFEARPGTNLQQQLPAGTRVACYGRPKGKKDRFIAAIGPDTGRTEGVISSLSGGQMHINIEGPQSGSTTITIPQDAQIRIDGSKAPAAQLQSGMRVAIFQPRTAASFK